MGLSDRAEPGYVMPMSTGTTFGRVLFLGDPASTAGFDRANRYGSLVG